MPQNPGTSYSKQIVTICGLWASISVHVSMSKQAQVAGSGGPGAECTWKQMIVQFMAQKTGTEQWEAFPGYSGEDRTWADTYDLSEYVRFRARTETFDFLDDEDHHADTGWIEGEIA